MNRYETVAARYIAAWNETDAEARAALIERNWAEDATYTDPLATVTGRESITAAIGAALPAWRRVVATAAQLGIPAPVFSSSLAYYDGLRRKRVAAALIQGQRDLFGAHTYGRVDTEGTFHTLWGEDKSEIEAVDTH